MRNLSPNGRGVPKQPLNDVGAMEAAQVPGEEGR
jgi:hypothetical protein